MTDNARTFHLGDILSVTTGRLVSPTHMTGISKLLDHLTSDNVFTHQIPRVVRECQPSLLAQHPDLSHVEVPEEFTGQEHVETWLAAQVARFGEFLPVAPLDAGEHAFVNPVEELASLTDAPVIVVLADDPTEG